ncbi:MAG: DUF4340 domain-containing protein [Ignavibacteriales bacterium]|nr:DUF4340 domain-containing protein [Ignavibacteriales bacterium]
MTRNTILLSGLLVVLLIVAVLVMQKPGERSLSGETGAVLASIDSLAVDKIEIKAPASCIVLQKNGVEWYLQSPVTYRADQSAVAGFLHESKALEVKNVVSNKPEKHSVFQVDSTGTLITIFEKGVEKVAFVLGKPTSTYSEMYARRSGSNDVLILSGTSPSAFSRPVKEWRDKTIFSAARDLIKEVRYQYGDTTFVLAFKDSAWTIGKDSTQESVVNNLLSSLSNVQADDFVDTLMQRPPRITAQVAYAGTQLSFSFLKQGEKYLVQSFASPQWFEMLSWHANEILKRKQDLKKPAR